MVVLQNTTKQVLVITTKNGNFTPIISSYFGVHLFTKSHFSLIKSAFFGDITYAQPEILLFFRKYPPTTTPLLLYYLLLFLKLLLA